MTAIATSNDRAGGVASRRATLGVAVGVSVAAFALGPVLFPPAAGMPEPTSGQLPLFMLLAALEAAVLGAAIVFAVRGGPAVRRLFSSDARARVVHLAVVWALGSWWLHDNLHLANGTDLGGLLAIEYAFHVTLIVTAALVAWVLFAEGRGRQA